MLKIGDRIVYPMHGAGVIAGIEQCAFMDEVREYYILQMPLGNLRVMIPLCNAEHIGLRDIIGAEELADVEQVLSGKPEVVPGSWNKRLQTNIDRMKSGDIRDVAAVARNLILQNQKRKVSSGERRVMDLARQILISELVFARGESPEEVEEWIFSVFSRAKTMREGAVS